MKRIDQLDTPLAPDPKRHELGLKEPNKMITRSMLKNASPTTKKRLLEELTITKRSKRKKDQVFEDIPDDIDELIGKMSHLTSSSPLKKVKKVKTSEDIDLLTNQLANITIPHQRSYKRSYHRSYHRSAKKHKKHGKVSIEDLTNKLTNIKISKKKKSKKIKSRSRKNKFNLDDISQKFQNINFTNDISDPKSKTKTKTKSKPIDIQDLTEKLKNLHITKNPDIEHLTTLMEKLK